MDSSYKQIKHEYNFKKMKTASLYSLRLVPEAQYKKKISSHYFNSIVFPHGWK